MPRDIVNVVLDRVIDQQDLVERALEATGPSALRLKVAMRRIFTGPGSLEQKRAAWRAAFVGTVIAEAAGHVPEAARLAEASLRAEVAAIRRAGPGKVRSIPALRKPEIMARAAERKEGLDGEAAKSSAA